MDIIKFSYNWNKKLNCTKAFSTIRLRNDKRYILGKDFMIMLKEKEKNTDFGVSRLSYIHHFTIEKLSPAMALIDTGYPLADCQKLIKTMYKNIVTDWSKQELSFMIFIKE
jgi:hypothetical protein